MAPRYFWLIFSVLTILCLVFIGRVLSSYEEKKEGLSVLKKLLEENNRINAELRNYSERLSKDVYTMERVFRDELNYSKKDDAIFLFENDEKLKKILLKKKKN